MDSSVVGLQSGRCDLAGGASRCLHWLLVFLIGFLFRKRHDHPCEPLDSPERVQRRIEFQGHLGSQAGASSALLRQCAHGAWAHQLFLLKSHETPSNRARNRTNPGKLFIRLHLMRHQPSWKHSIPRVTQPVYYKRAMRHKRAEIDRVF